MQLDTEAIAILTNIACQVRGVVVAPVAAQSIPLGRLGKSSDVARAVSFFSSPDADFITGQTLYVCGGASIGSISI